MGNLFLPNVGMKMGMIVNVKKGSGKKDANNPHPKDLSKRIDI